MAAPRPGNTDRGWNDPPMFDYQGTASSTNSGSPQHTKLNKRVAYPMSSDAELPLPTGTATLLNPSEGPPRLAPVQILPPTSTTTTPTPVPVVVPTISPTTDPCGDCILTPAIFSPTAATVPGIARVVGSDIKVKDLACVLADLSLQTEEALLEYVKEGLHSAAESVNDALKGRAMEDVKKKVALMGEWWACGKISQSVKSQLGSLVEALNKQLVEEAHELHVALMINHTTEVNQWMVGVKRIIQELRAKVTGSEVNQDEGQGQPKDAADPCWTLQGESLLIPALQPAALTDPQPTGDAKDPQPTGDAKDPQPTGDAKDPQPTGDAKDPQPTGDAKDPQPTGDAKDPQPTGDAKDPQPTGDAKDTSQKKDTGTCEEGGS